MTLRPRTRLVAMLATAACALAWVGVFSVRADPSPSLPTVAADRLIADSLEALAQPITISGQVRTKLDLGLPELPTDLAGGAAGAASSLIGTQTYKVWRSPDGVRAAHIFDFSEQVLVANHREAWSWDSNGMVATRLRFADIGGLLSRGVSNTGQILWLGDGLSGSGLPTLPTDADVLAWAGRVLDALAPYADITVAGTAMAAGRSVYELVLTPRSGLTLIGRIVVPIDAGTRLPLRLQVIPKGSDDAAIDAGFTSVSFDPIDSAMFDFTPPAGATVDVAATADGTPTGSGSAGPATPGDGSPEPTVGAPRVFGSGFDARVAVRLRGPLPTEAQQLLPYAGPLSSAMTVETDGHTWFLFGFVGIDTLRRDAASLP